MNVYGPNNMGVYSFSIYNRVSVFSELLWKVLARENNSHPFSGLILNDSVFVLFSIHFHLPESFFSTRAPSWGHEPGLGFSEA